MTAREIVVRRTTMDSEEASIYIRISESRIRSYLHYTEDDDLSGFDAVIADIAILLWEEDKARRAATIAENANSLKSESFSEGGVSVKNEYLSGTEIAAAYEERISLKLSELSAFMKTTNDMHKVRFL